MYSLALEKFSGPLDMLLNLVEDQKLSINEISLSQIADQYISYLKSVEELSKDELASFLVIAATLILIKSRSLMPHLPISEEERLDISELEKRLKTFKFFKELSLYLAKFQKDRNHCFGREAYVGMHSIFFPPESLKPSDLATVMSNIILSIPTKEILPTDTIVRTVSIEEKMLELKDRLERTFAMTFDEMRSGTKEKLDVIVSFLAILELVKEGFLMIEQERLFDNIKMTRKTNE